MRAKTPDWFIQIIWFAAGISATGAFWYFLSQKNYKAALWAGVAAAVFVLFAVVLHRWNDLIRREKPLPPLSQPTASPLETATNPTPAPQELVSNPDDSEKEAYIAAQDPSYSSMTMEEYFDAWYRKATTSLQRDALEEQLLRRRVVWAGQIKSIESKSDGCIQMTVEPLDGSFGTAFLDFEKSHRSELLKLHKHQQIRFTGIVRSFVASPFLSDCIILRILR